MFSHFRNRWIDVELRLKFICKAAYDCDALDEWNETNDANLHFLFVLIAIFHENVYGDEEKRTELTFDFNSSSSETSHS